MKTFRYLLLSLACLLPAFRAMADEMTERRAVTTKALMAMGTLRFAEIEEETETYRSQKVRTPSGVWKLPEFYEGLNTSITTTARQEEGFAWVEKNDFGKWIAQYPTSPTAQIMLSKLHIHHAWLLRGDGPASSVKKEAWPIYNKHLAAARAVLEKSKPFASRDPHWYATMLTIARYQGWPRAEFDTLLEEAIAREPSYHPIYFAAAEYLAPKWHGDNAQIEAFAQYAARISAKTQGGEMYARIYWYVASVQYRGRLFTASAVNWGRMKQGFENLIARYPDPWNVSNYAMFACMAHDKARTQELLLQLGGNYQFYGWSLVRLDDCMRWAAAR